MNLTILGLLIFGLWTLFLALIVVVWRATKVIGGQTPADGFPSGERHGSDAYWRVNRAHMNALENLPLFATVALAGVVMDVADLSFGTLALIVAAARIVQSSVHLRSGSVKAVNLRFTAYVVQLICIGWMAVDVIIKAGLIPGSTT
ncbi:MAG: MAPEG family protein [Alphaproteobacteria bacterium]